MNILVLHNAYQHRGGEDTVVAAEVELLRHAGHEVHLEVVTNDAIGTMQDKARAFLNTPYDARRKAWLTAICKRQNVDLVHIHNFFPLLTPAVHEAAAELGLPVVQTLHNYRVLCAGAFFLRDGQICEKCLSGNRAWGVIHRCYRNSLPGSLAVVRMQNRASHTGTWQRHVHRFIALTEFGKQKFVAGGLPAERIAIKPNFVPAPPAFSAGRRKGALFVGRLSPEKGVRNLIDAWRHMPDIPLTVIGDGPEFDTLKDIAPPNVTFAGRQTADRVASHMAQAEALIMPSIWYEGFPMTVVEAFSLSLPVIASDIGALGEVVVKGRNGAHFAAGNIQNLVETVSRLFADPQELHRLGLGARADYEGLYTAYANLDTLLDIYDSARREAASQRV